MRFTISDDAISRLRLDTDTKGRVFEGPQVDRGLLTGFPTGETRWARRALLNGQTLQEVSVEELENLYYFLSVRRSAPTLLSDRMFEQLATADYEIVPHLHVGEQVTCTECLLPLRHAVHDVPEDDAQQF